MASLPGAHPSLAVHLADRSLTPIISSSTSQESNQKPRTASQNEQHQQQQTPQQPGESGEEAEDFPPLPSQQQHQSPSQPHHRRPSQKTKFPTPASALSFLTATALAAQTAATHLELGTPLRIMVETGDGGPVVINSFIEPPPSPPPHPPRSARQPPSLPPTPGLPPPTSYSSRSPALARSPAHPPPHSPYIFPPSHHHHHQHPPLVTSQSYRSQRSYQNLYQHQQSSNNRHSLQTMPHHQRQHSYEGGSSHPHPQFHFPNPIPSMHHHDASHSTANTPRQQHMFDIGPPGPSPKTPMSTSRHSHWGNNNNNNNNQGGYFNLMPPEHDYDPYTGDRRSSSEDDGTSFRPGTEQAPKPQPPSLIAVVIAPDSSNMPEARRAAAQLERMGHRLQLAWFDDD